MIQSVFSDTGHVQRYRVCLVIRSVFSNTGCVQ